MNFLKILKEVLGTKKIRTILLASTAITLSIILTVLIALQYSNYTNKTQQQNSDITSEVGNTEGLNPTQQLVELSPTVSVTLTPESNVLGTHISKTLSPSITPKTKIAPSATSQVINGCTNMNKINNLTQSINSTIQKLNDYQTACNSFVTNKLMIFTSVSVDENQAEAQAQDFTYTLKEFTKYNLSPIVIAEPTTANGVIDFQAFKNGANDKAVDKYFAKLKSLGITDQQLGTWVAFPEINIPEWDNHSLSPSDFVSITNRYYRILRKYYPNAKTSILLDSMTYTPDDTSWSKGTHSSLVPFVDGIDKGLINNFGLQGFPWKPAANQNDTASINAAEFLNYKLATDAANKLGIKNIWFNTGTFSAYYTNNSKQTVYSSTDERKTILNGILQQAVSAKKLGYTVGINLFAQDKSKTAEAVNWSYLNTNADRIMFIDYIKNLLSQGFELSLYDSK